MSTRQRVRNYYLSNEKTKLKELEKFLIKEKVNCIFKEMSKIVVHLTSDIAKNEGRNEFYKIYVGACQDGH